MVEAGLIGNAGTGRTAVTAADRGLLSCSVCGSVHPLTRRRCTLCGKRLTLRKPNSVQRCLALLATAVVLYVPASALPIMTTQQLGRVTGNTIAGGVVVLWNLGSYGIAVIILIASVLVPLAKMLAIALLCWYVMPAGQRLRRVVGVDQMARLYGLTELIGKWSMVDVFVVALLVALIQLGTLLSIQAGPAALAFAGVVLFTMLAARAFDLRLIWDTQRRPSTTRSGAEHGG